MTNPMHNLTLQEFTPKYSGAIIGATLGIIIRALEISLLIYIAIKG